MLVTGRKLPIGIQTFEDIRNDGYLYVDKTALMWTIANIGKPFFLSRPRRFGKSLLISTFEAYFKGRRELFTGLAVEELEKKWEEHPVLHLDLNAEKYDSPERLDAILSNQLTQWEAIYGVGNDETTLSSRFLGVIRRASEQTGKGVVTALKASGETLENKTVTILGAGGAARAIAVECALNGARQIHIINRSQEKGMELAALIRSRTKSDSAYIPWTRNIVIPEDTDILINGTSIGFSPNVTEKPDVDYTSIRPNMCVCDVIFNPCDTLFLKAAQKNGAKTVNGLGMLVQQAALNFTLWTGEEAPVEVMEEALRKEF